MSVFAQMSQEIQRLKNLIKEMDENLYALYWWDGLSWADGTPKHEDYEHIPNLIKRIKKELPNNQTDNSPD